LHQSSAFESPQRELRGSATRILIAGATGPIGRLIRAYTIARFPTSVEGNWRGGGHRRCTGRRGEGRRRTDPARRCDQENEEGTQPSSPKCRLCAPVSIARRFAERCYGHYDRGAARARFRDDASNLRGAGYVMTCCRRAPRHAGKLSVVIALRSAVAKLGSRPG
jgi:hypothetical protein